ncbi:MAG: response regulator [Raineya sp.]
MFYSTTSPQKIVLYVDDEPRNLSSFKSVFRRHYEVYLANSAEEGINIMEQVPVQLVITDQRMPKVSGVEFLEKINEKFPEVTRILLTGYSDLDAIVDAINKGKIFKYVAKPWKAEELKETIDVALELSHLKKQNKHLIENLQKTNQELDNFVYRAAHDLRGPIANLLGLINLAKMEEDLPTIKNYIDLKEQTIRRLDGFIHDIVNYSSNLRLAVSKNTIDFKILVEKVLQQHQFTPKFSQIQKEVHIEQSTEMLSDAERVGVILNNLISNAIRYSVINRQEKAFIKIEISNDEEKAVIKVADNGEGIEEKYHQKVFEMFFRASPNARDGSGLGLFICKEIVEKLQGRIWFESEKDKGSIFFVELPNLKKEIL